MCQCIFNRRKHICISTWTCNRTNVYVETIHAPAGLHGRVFTVAHIHISTRLNNALAGLPARSTLRVRQAYWLLRPTLAREAQGRTWHMQPPCSPTCFAYCPRRQLMPPLLHQRMGQGKQRSQHWPLVRVSVGWIGWAGSCV